MGGNSSSRRSCMNSEHSKREAGASKQRCDWPGCRIKSEHYHADQTPPPGANVRLPYQTVVALESTEIAEVLWPRCTGCGTQLARADVGLYKCPACSSDETTGNLEAEVGALLIGCGYLDRLNDTTPEDTAEGICRELLASLEPILTRHFPSRRAAEPTPSSSLQRRVAAVRGEPAPEFGLSEKATEGPSNVK